MRTTAMAVTYIVALAFPSFAALGQGSVGDSAIRTARSSGIRPER